MGWSEGYDEFWKRDIGYAVSATCDHPDCDAKIDRGLAYVCCGQQPYGGECGCGLYFCGEHAGADHQCERCQAGEPPFDAKPDAAATGIAKPRELPPSMTSAWISVRDRLPELFERVLVFDPSIPKFTSRHGIVRSHNFVVIGYYCGEDALVSPWCVPDGTEPTHWMPLPNDPIQATLEDSRGQFVRVAE